GTPIRIVSFQGGSSSQGLNARPVERPDGRNRLVNFSTMIGTPSGLGRTRRWSGPGRQVGFLSCNGSPAGQATELLRRVLRSDRQTRTRRVELNRPGQFDTHVFLSRYFGGGSGSSNRRPWRGCDGNGTVMELFP